MQLKLKLVGFVVALCLFLPVDGMGWICGKKLALQSVQGGGASRALADETEFFRAFLGYVNDAVFSDTSKSVPQSFDPLSELSFRLTGGEVFGPLPKGENRLPFLMEYAQEGNVRLEGVNGVSVDRGLELVPEGGAPKRKKLAELRIAVGYNAVTKMLEGVRSRGLLNFDDMFLPSVSGVASAGSIAWWVHEFIESRGELNGDRVISTILSTLFGSGFIWLSGGALERFIRDFKLIIWNLRSINKLLDKWKNRRLSDSELEQVIWIGLNLPLQGDFFFHFAVQDNTVIPVMYEIRTPPLGDPPGQEVVVVE